MDKYVSGRQRELKVGLSSYSENKTVIQTVGKVGVGTTNAEQYSLKVIGDTNIVGDINVSGASTFVGVATFGNDVYIDNQLYVSEIEISGSVVIGEDISTRNLFVSGVSTFIGTSDFNSDLNVDGYAQIENLDVTTGTIGTLFSSNSNLTNIYSTGISTFGITNILDNSSTNALTITQTGSGNALVVQPNTSGLVVTDAGFVGIGNSTPGEALQVSGNVRIGSSESNYIAFRGTSGDGAGEFNHTYIGERVYDPGTELSELFIFKGNDPDIATIGPDRIRLAAAEIRLDTYTVTTPLYGPFEDAATSVNLDTRVTVKGNGFVGVGTTNPISTLDVYGDFNVSGIGTIETLDVTIGASDFLSNTNLNNTGIATLDITIITQHYVS